MISLGISILILAFGYFIYSKYVEKVFGADSKRPTPAVTMTDGVDYLPMPWWQLFPPTSSWRPKDLICRKRFPIRLGAELLFSHSSYSQFISEMREK